MLRGSVLSLVLLLAAGQDPALLCSMWCDPGSAASAECHEQVRTTTSPRLTGDDSCGRVVANGAILIREDLRRISDHDARYGILVPCYHAPASPHEVRQGSDPGCASSLALRPLVLALRI